MLPNVFPLLYYISIIFLKTNTFQKIYIYIFPFAIIYWHTNNEVYWPPILSYIPP